MRVNSLLKELMNVFSFFCLVINWWPVMDTGVRITRFLMFHLCRLIIVGIVIDRFIIIIDWYYHSKLWAAELLRLNKQPLSLLVTSVLHTPCLRCWTRIQSGIMRQLCINVGLSASIMHDFKDQQSERPQNWNVLLHCHIWRAFLYRDKGIQGPLLLP